MTDSARLALPYLDAGQAQKEWTHNEALALIDIAVQASVEAVGVDAPPASPAAGACWIVGAAPSGAWNGHAGAIAGWTDGGWRFLAPRPGMAAWSRADATAVRYGAQGWRLDRVAPIASPTGGATVDAECRSAVVAILGALRAQGWLA
ncbi:DUF2793 domain-containing protein [Sphingomonas sp.]|jgi:hypothetical protein|uniref:DUF2793 domain-containing protein n=1 Tax=Sphingomonas sp. TaxID=28214 RepID=UPI002EDACD4A